MVAPPSFEGPFFGSAALQRPGTTGESQKQSATRQANPGQSARRIIDQPSGAPTDREQRSTVGNQVRGSRPVFQQLSSPFVAQFIAQELNPPPQGQRNALATERALSAYQQRLARTGRG